MEAFVYRNRSREQHPENHYLKVELQGHGMNRYAIGSTVTVYYGGGLQSYQECMPMRGFESTVDNRLNFGLGSHDQIDSVVVRWPTGIRQVYGPMKADQWVKWKEPEQGAGEGAGAQVKAGVGAGLLRVSSGNYGIDFVHRENAFVDFDRDKLIYHMLSTEGPRMSKADVNGDGREDIYICGARDQAGALYIQDGQGRFHRSNEKLLEADKGSEDTDALFFDADGDGDMDLFVCSGGSEFSPNSTALISRLYINNGKGLFSKSAQLLPSAQSFESASCVSAADYDGDGDMDLFVGVRSRPFQYGYPCKGYILRNDGKGQFSDVSKEAGGGVLEQLGMITDGKWVDYDRDGKADLVVTGEYMPIRLFHNEGGGRLKEVTEQAGLKGTEGWWKRMVIADVNGDGYEDIIAGNQGYNSRFHCNDQQPVELWVSDFDQNGTVEQVLTCYNGEKSYPMALRHDLVEVLPYLKKKYLKYEKYKEQTITDIFNKDQLSKAIHLQAREMGSVVLLNTGKGGYEKKVLPMLAQVSPVYGISVEDYDGDGQVDLLIGGNFYESKPEVGVYDASYGLLLKGDGKGNFIPVSPDQSGISIRGAIRDMLSIKAGKEQVTIVAMNNSAPVFIRQSQLITTKKPVAKK